MEKIVFDNICNELKGIIGEKNINKLPKTYELIGNILIIHIPEDLSEWKKEIGKIYLKNFPRAKTVLKKGRISGEYRKPEFEYLAGDGTETVHTENFLTFLIPITS